MWRPGVPLLSCTCAMPPDIAQPTPRAGRRQSHRKGHAQMSAIARPIRSVVTSARFYGRNLVQAMRVVDCRDLLDRHREKSGVKIPNDERALFLIGRGCRRAPTLEPNSTAVGQTSEFQAGIVFGKTALDHEGTNDSASSSMESPAHPSVHQTERTRQEDGAPAVRPIAHPSAASFMRRARRRGAVSSYFSLRRGSSVATHFA
jgi:hypothetical protein